MHTSLDKPTFLLDILLSALLISYNIATSIPQPSSSIPLMQLWSPQKYSSACTCSIFQPCDHVDKADKMKSGPLVYAWQTEVLF